MLDSNTKIKEKITKIKNSFSFSKCISFCLKNSILLIVSLIALILIGLLGKSFLKFGSDKVGYVWIVLIVIGVLLFFFRRTQFTESLKKGYKFLHNYVKAIFYTILSCIVILILILFIPRITSDEYYLVIADLPSTYIEQGYSKETLKKFFGLHSDNIQNSDDHESTFEIDNDDTNLKVEALGNSLYINELVLLFRKLINNDKTIYIQFGQDFSQENGSSLFFKGKITNGDKNIILRKDWFNIESDKIKEENVRAITHRAAYASYKYIDLHKLISYYSNNYEGLQELISRIESQNLPLDKRTEVHLYRVLGNAEANIGFNQKALSNYQKALEIYKDSDVNDNDELRMLNESYVICLYNLGRAEEAKEFAQYQFPDSRLKNNILGFLHSQTGYPEEAIKFYEKTLLRSTLKKNDSVKSYYWAFTRGYSIDYLIDSYLSLGEVDKSLSLINRISNIYSKDFVEGYRAKCEYLFNSEADYNSLFKNIGENEIRESFRSKNKFRDSYTLTEYDLNLEMAARNYPYSREVVSNVIISSLYPDAVTNIFENYLDLFPSDIELVFKLAFNKLKNEEFEEAKYWFDYIINHQYEKSNKINQLAYLGTKESLIKSHFQTNAFRNLAVWGFSTSQDSIVMKEFENQYIKEDTIFNSINNGFVKDFVAYYRSLVNPIELVKNPNKFLKDKMPKNGVFATRLKKGLTQNFLTEEAKWELIEMIQDRKYVPTKSLDSLFLEAVFLNPEDEELWTNWAIYEDLQGYSDIADSKYKRAKHFNNEYNPYLESAKLLRTGDSTFHIASDNYRYALESDTLLITQENMADYYNVLTQAQYFKLLSEEEYNKHFEDFNNLNSKFVFSNFRETKKNAYREILLDLAHYHLDSNKIAGYNFVNLLPTYFDFGGHINDIPRYLYNPILEYDKKKVMSILETYNQTHNGNNGFDLSKAGVIESK